MNSLFSKILVSFWLALILFVGLTLWSTSYYLEKVRTQANVDQPRFNLLQYSKQAQQAYNTRGDKGLRDWLQELDRREAIPYLLIDPQGKDYIDRPVPVQIQQRILRHKQKHHDREYDDYEKSSRKYLRRTYVIADGIQYRLIPDFLNITLTRLLNRPKVIAIPILLAILISGIVCFLLARYLTAPIGQLRQATLKLAKGDLDQRVSPAMGKRKDEISGLANDFDHMAEQLQKLLDSHKQLLRDASHELRSPLARLQVALGLARQRSKDGSIAELDRIEREAERLNEIIGQLLSLARLQSETAIIDNEAVDLHSLIEDLVRDAAYEARAKNRDVVFSGHTPVIVEGRSSLLRSALENIIRNAIRYTSEHSTVEISLAMDSTNRQRVEIKVRDHGPGIPHNMHERIFEPFVRVGEARDRDSGGYGLGLAIASRAIKLHGGQITAHNEPDNGMSIIIHLPISDDAGTSSHE
jgi:two-component system sensor histidine kinase CpxA